MAPKVVWREGVAAFLVLAVVALSTSTSATILPPRLSSNQTELRLKEGQTEVVLICTLDVGDDPVSYRWLKNHQWVTGALGFAYRGYRQLLLALHAVQKHHEGTYVCEASNPSGVHSYAIKVIVEKGDQLMPDPTELPRTDEILGDIATSFSDVLAEGDCNCDALFFIHASPDAPPEAVAAQANLVHTIADSIISENLRVSVMTYSDSIDTKLPFGRGTNRCALRKAFEDLSQPAWATRIEPVFREAFKKLKKNTSGCKVMFFPIFGSLGQEGPDPIGARTIKKLGVKIFILEITNKPIAGVKEMASERGDGQPYHWYIPMHIWPTVVMYMKYMTEELGGCKPEESSIPGVCVGLNEECTSNDMCDGAGHGCIEGRCQPLQCNINSKTPGCCSNPGQYWCGDVTRHCTDGTNICDGKVQCMNGADEDRCWSEPCTEDKVARCQSSTLCLDLMDLCDGEPACPGGEDEDPRFCRSFPCPLDRPFRCRSGKCIEKRKLCDGTFKNCEEGEDEDLDYCSRVHSCPDYQPFKCDYGICISEKMLCDGSYNCLDASDELVCEKRSCPAERPYKCSSGLCISMDKVCNGIIDGCDDGGDEKNCSEIVCPVDRSFKCNDGRCIDEMLQCDGNNDCRDGSDETNCGQEVPTTTERQKPTCRSGEFQCDSGACISEANICDGRLHCIEGDDEKNCRIRPCPSNRPHRCDDHTCVASAPPCDGIEQCSDGSDELNCSPTDEPTLYDDYEDYDEDDDYDESYDYGIGEPEPHSPTSETKVELEDYADYGRDTLNSDDNDVLVRSEAEPEPEPGYGDGTVLEDDTFPEGKAAKGSTLRDGSSEDNDIEDLNTILEEAEPEPEPEPEQEASKEGSSGRPSAMPLIVYVLTPLLALNLRYMWMR